MNNTNSDLGMGESVQSDHWFQVGERSAEKVLASDSKNTAEQEANIKSLYGKPRMSFIAGFRLYMANKQKEAI
jgi:hypothetical protein